MSKRSLKAWVPVVLWAAVLFGLSSLHRVPGSTLFPYEDKVGHFCLYAVMGAALAHVRKAYGSGLAPHWALLGVGWAYGALDEFHQSFVPGRDPDIHDWVVDVIGVSVWYAVTLYVTRRSARQTAADAGPAGPGAAGVTSDDPSPQT